jgi:hypothetical protein
MAYRGFTHETSLTAISQVCGGSARIYFERLDWIYRYVGVSVNRWKYEGLRTHKAG